MKVTVSVLGRFHAFYLARELDRRGCLDHLVTSYPSSGAARWGVPKNKVRSLWPLEAARRILPGAALRAIQNWGAFQEMYDALAARRLPESSDLVVAWSGSAERTLKRALENGQVTIVERCSTHIREQREILREEYERHGGEASLPSETIVGREEREYELADRIAVPSSFVERSFLRQGLSREKLVRIPYGVDPEEFAPVQKDDDIFRVVFAGSIGVRKGITYLLEAFKGLDLPDSELLLLGSIRDEAKAWRGQFEDERIRTPGHIPQRELHRWYSQGSVFVLPSIEEGMAYVQLQAMACGLPLICTPNTGGEDLIREGKEGFVVPVRSPEALVERLQWCYQHRRELRGMGQAARRRVLENFTWRDYGERVHTIYTELMRLRE